MLVASEQCILISFSSSVGNHLERCFTLNKCLHDSPACLFWSHIICHKWPLNQTSGKKRKREKKIMCPLRTGWFEDICAACVNTSWFSQLAHLHFSGPDSRFPFMSLKGVQAEQRQRPAGFWDVGCPFDFSHSPKCGLLICCLLNSARARL